LKGVLIELDKNPNWQGNISWLSKIHFFYLRRFKIANRKINLYNLENKVLRKQFKDPRIHFAINCASASCPYLPGRLFQVEILETYLEELTSVFINDSNNVAVNPEKKEIMLNRIFKWYKDDFASDGGILAFIERYHKNISESLENYRIEYFKYDWSLNKQ
jgi:hypothetical protein